jgi:hypothetical protein
MTSMGTHMGLLFSPILTIMTGLLGFTRNIPGFA